MEQNASRHEAIITTSKLTKSFGSLVAVNALDLDIRQGDVFGVLGPNGSGKTTTIRMLMGLLRPTSGEASLFGLDNQTHLQEILPRIGAIIETPVSYSYLSGYDNLWAISQNSNMRAGEATRKRIHEILEMVNLQDTGNRAVGKYSLGMKQRLAIGMALLANPEMILLDEPTNGLDPMGVHEIRQLILRLSASGKTIILSSHILSEVQQVCNRVIILRKGRMIKQGAVSDLLSGGEHLVVRMNTPEEARMALYVLQQAQKDEATWITDVVGVAHGANESSTLLHIHAPLTQASTIVALLAQQHLYLAEIRPEQPNLESVFMELVAPNEQRNGAVLLS